MQKVIALGAGTAVVYLCLLGWIGGEVHYRNCLTEAELRNPVAARWDEGRSETSIGGVPLGAPGGVKKQTPIPAHFAFYGQQRRDAALDQCSHWPF